LYVDVERELRQRYFLCIMEQMTCCCGEAHRNSHFSSASKALQKIHVARNQHTPTDLEPFHGPVDQTSCI
jgi:hypothetical protein